jgi:hypothetical protein
MQTAIIFVQGMYSPKSVIGSPQPGNLLCGSGQALSFGLRPDVRIIRRLKKSALLVPGLSPVKTLILQEKRFLFLKKSVIVLNFGENHLRYSESLISTIGIGLNPQD